MKRIVAAVMAMIMILSVVPVIGLSALAETAEYTVKFYEDETKSTVKFERTLKKGDAYTLDFEPYIEGYTFIKWVDAETGDTLVLTNGNGGIIPDKDTEYYGVWQKNVYKLFYRDGNEENDGIFASYDVDYGTPSYEMPVPENEPKKEGAVFDGWSALPLTMPAHDESIKAQWIYNDLYANYYITVEGKELHTSIKYSKCETISEPETPPVREGYTFEGWSLDGETVTGDFGIMDSQNVSVYAVWTANEYSAVFNASGGKFSDGSTEKSVTVAFDSKISFTSVPARNGYTFGGWDAEVDTMDSTSGKIFNATWIPVEKNYYTVETYIMNADGAYEKSESLISGDAGTIVTAEYEVAEGFKFNSLKSKLQGVITSSNSLILKVYIDRNYYTFTVNADGVQTKISYLYGAKITVPENPVKADHLFLGWEPQIPSTMPASNYTVTATWISDHNHVTKEVVIKPTCTQEGKKYFVCETCSQIIGRVEKIPASGHNAGEWIVTAKPTFDTAGKRIRKCSVCSETVAEEIIEKKAYSNATVSIRNNPNDATINYGETLRLTAQTYNMSENYRVEWVVVGSGAVISRSDNTTCEITSVENGTVQVFAKIVDEDGEFVKGTNGQEIYDSQFVTSRAGFFRKIIAFFKKLFGINQVITQSVKFGF